MRRIMVCVLGFFVFAAISMLPAGVLAGNCLECHGKQGVTIKPPVVAPIKMMVDGKERTITLDGVFRFHGDVCPGATIAYRGVQYGIRLLYGNEIPDRNDLVVVSRTPAAGVKDFLDFFMKGDKPSMRTLPPPGMQMSRDGFIFTVMRRSTCEAVELPLNHAFFPPEFFSLRKKNQENTITEDERGRFHACMKNIVRASFLTPAEEMFGKPKPYKIIVWGTVGSGELDRNVRAMKQKGKVAQSR
jgi:hypothetical protein